MGEPVDPPLGLREQARRLAHANSLFHGGRGGRDDNVAVWAYAEDIWREKNAELDALRAENAALRDQEARCGRERDALRAENDELRASRDNWRSTAQTFMQWRNEEAE